VIFDRLAIGTANFGKEYNGVKVPETEQRKILDYCRDVGVDMLDTATAYGTHNIEAEGFKKVIKWQSANEVRKSEINPDEVYCMMAHNSLILDFDGWALFNGASLYYPGENLRAGHCKILQVPYSLYDRRFENIFPALKARGAEIHVRSVFLRGRILEKVLPHDCISFCLMNPYVDRVIIGVDSLEQLKKNLETFVMFDSLKTDDEEIIDPRRWKNEKN